MTVIDRLREKWREKTQSIYLDDQRLSKDSQTGLRPRCQGTELRLEERKIID
jgi:hypothetical protein